MGEANENENRSREMLNLSLQIDKYPRDLLQRFVSTTTSDSQQQSQELTLSEENKTEEIELNLGLSLGGRFGADKNGKMKLFRSSSIAGPIPTIRESDFATRTTTNVTSSTQAVTFPTIIRTSSLPTETEEVWRKRKELQSLRRMEAKRRRSEKQRNSSSSANNSAKMDMALNLEDEKQNLVRNRAVGPLLGMQSWAAAARQVLLGVGVKGASSCGGGGGFLQGLERPCSQGSVESQGGNSSGVSEFESKPLQGTSSDGEARSPVTRALQDQNNQEALGTSATTVNENVCRTSGLEMEKPSKKLSLRSSRGREMNAYEDMPCVFTKGDGPNGRKIEGILYRYGKAEEVRIMCVCHGSFLSPAEFVKHAGGGDVDHPLRHIVVIPSAAPFS